MLPSANSKVLQKSTIDLIVFLAALFLRLLHNTYAMRNPLYAFPLGGHVYDLELARKIAGGKLLPGSGPLTLNSPLYPYLLAFQYQIIGVGQFLIVRFLTILLDSVTCVLIARLAYRHSGSIAALLAGLFAACYGPLIFYSTELMPVPYTVFFTVLTIYLLDTYTSLATRFVAGLAMGLAVGTRPDLIILAFVLSVLLFIGKQERGFARSTAFSIAFLVAISPITLLNYLASGRFVLLTVSGGHSFYLGHNPDSTAGYTLPSNMDGDIFASMKKTAEQTEGRPFGDNEVSSYYMRKALAHIRSNPFSEIKLVGTKLAAAVNDFEASTYVNYYFTQEISPVLAYAISFGWLFPLAALGILISNKRILLLVPIIATLITLILFFYIARLRMPMVPFLIIFAAGAAVQLLSWISDRQWKQLTMSLVVLVLFAFVANRTTVESDASNEWNKVGIVLRRHNQFPEAEQAFLTAQKRNPQHPNSYLNLAVLYEKQGYLDKAASMRALAKTLNNAAEEEQQFLKNLAPQ